MSTMTEISALDLALAADGIRAVYQPIVDVETGAVVAYEALARGPVGSDVERPDLLFGAARASRRLDEVDWACRAAAVRGALEAGLEQTLFVNVEPESLGAPVPRDLEDLWRRAG